MTNPHAKAVEAAARGMRELAIPITNKVEPWETARPSEREVWLTHAGAAITAYLAAMRGAGWVMVRDVGKDNTTDAASDYNRGERDGWNACRAIMLGGAGDGQG